MENTQVKPNQPVIAKPNGQLTEMEAMKVKIAELEAKLAAGNNSGAIAYKCRAAGEQYQDASGKTQTGTGTLSMYGLGRFPASYYESQWKRIIEEVKSGRLEAKLEEFKTKLAHKS